MMKTFKTVTAAAAIAAVGAFSADAASVSVLEKVPAAWAAVNLNQTLATPGATWTTAPSVVSGTVSAVYKSPFNPVGGNTLANWEQIEYYTVGSPGYASSPAILSLTAERNSFKMLWGSVDTYNVLEFYNNGALVYTVTGGMIIPPSQPAGGASLIRVTGLTYDEVHFRADNTPNGNDRAAFEFANVSAVPLPAGGLLLLSAMGGVAALRRRKDKKA